MQIIFKSLIATDFIETKYHVGSKILVGSALFLSSDQHISEGARSESKKTDKS